MKAAPTCIGSNKTIIREPHPVLSYNYISGTNVRIITDVISVMAAYAAITMKFIKLVHLFVLLHKFKYRYFIKSLRHYFAEEFSHDSKQHDACHYSILPCIRDHEFQFHVLQLLLGFNSLHLQKVLESVSYGWQTCVTHNTLFTACCNFVIWAC